MRIWLVATLAVALAVAAGWLWLLNPAPVAVHLTPGRSWTLPLGAALVAALAGGAGLIAALWLAGAGGRAWRAWQARRASRRAARHAASTARARALVWSGAYAHARAELSRGESALSDRGRAALLAEAHLREGDAVAARRVLEEALPRLGPDPCLLDLLAGAAEALGDTAGAVAALEQARRLDPASPRLLLRLRDAYLASRRWADALPLEGEILLAARSPDVLAAETTVLQGIRYELACAEADDARAARRLARLARDAPEFLPAVVAAGDRWVAAGRPRRARRIWRRGTLVRPAPVLLARLEALDAAAGRPERTIRLYDRLRRRHPEDPLLAACQVRNLLANDRLAAARQALDALPASARGPAVEALRAEWHRRGGDLGAAVESYARALGPGLGLHGAFRCAACPATPTAWAGRCEGCGRWNTIEVVPALPVDAAARPQPISLPNPSDKAISPPDG